MGKLAGNQLAFDTCAGTCIMLRRSEEFGDNQVKVEEEYEEKGEEYLEEEVEESSEEKLERKF